MKYKQLNLLVTTLLILGLLVSCRVKAASPAAGTLIQNQASASYKDATGALHFTTSNLVETFIQHVAAMELVQDQTRPGALDSVVYFPHVLTNNGNDTDSFLLAAINNAGDQYDFASIKIFVDKDRDGLPDNTTEIGTTGNLAALEEFYFVVEALLPVAGPSSGDQGKLTVTGTSSFDNTVTRLNTDTIVLSDSAIVNVTKSMSASTGYSPSSLFTVTLNYANDSNLDASNVTLIDALPAGMVYIPGSAKWNGIGLTDSDKTDQAGIIFCAYNVSCTGLPTNGSSIDQATAIIATVAAGRSGTVSFNVQIASGIAAAIIHNTADYEYNNGSAVTARISSNKVPYEVLARPQVVANGSSNDADPDNADNLGGTTDAFIVASANQGATVVFDNIIRNRGNSEDTFDISLNTAVANPFPANTVFQLYQADGFTPLLDTNSNGTVDTGPLAAGDQYKVVLKAVLPVDATLGNNGGAGFHVSKKATSSIDTTVFDSVTDTLQTITGASVDLTNNAAVGDAAASGVGVGPEVTPVTTVTTAPGNKAVFNVFVNNTSDVSSSYQLEYSMANPFVAGNVDANWVIRFFKDGGNNDCSTQGVALTSTGAIAPQSNTHICAVVTLPTNAIVERDVNGVAIKHSVYFRAISALNGVSDIKHDAVIVADQPALSIEPDQQGQIQPGNTKVYHHIVRNNGNAPLECINIGLQNTQTDWTSILYKDVNGDGLLDNGDAVLTDQSLNPGESFTALVKLFAPATVSLGTKNTTTLTLSGFQDDGDGNTATCNGMVLANGDKAVDVTTVNVSGVTIRKEQSADNNCDGISDSGIFTTSSFQMAPQSCVIYRLTATNEGTTTVNNVRINDATPAFTVFYNVAGLPMVSQGAIKGGLAGSEGNITGGTVSGGASISLNAGQSMVLTFAVQLN